MTTEYKNINNMLIAGAGGIGVILFFGIVVRVLEIVYGLLYAGLH